ncbi:filamin-A-like isoform X5 [Saccostrea cucullata]|uniref:filamin-A-like isoform X5 n=1 Tax=Saccostrea cuccullata TaxID=36930 RepID=UPI002ED10745
MSKIFNFCIHKKFKMPAPDAEGLGPEIKDNTDGSISVQYHPNKSGRHEVQMCYEGCAVEGSPFSCMVDQIDGSYVTAFGAGLVGGMSGQMVAFTVTAKQGTLSKLDVKVDGPTKTDISRKDLGDKCDISFLPMTPGVYNIIIKYNGKEMKGSPFVSKVSVHENGIPKKPGEGRKRSQLSLGNSAEYSLNVLETNVVDLVGSIKLPSGAIEPCLLKKDVDGHLCVGSFAPKSTGLYAVHISREEKPIKGSPFHINVGDKELAHAAKVKVTGPTTKAKANEPNILDIDCSEAGYGGLSIVIEGPHRSEIECKHYENRKYQISYSPHEPGIYILNLRFADDHLPGSPFLLQVEGEPSGRIRETVTKTMEQAEPVKKNQNCEFYLQIPGTNPFDMEASVTDPEGSTELCEIMDEEDFHYRMMFTPQMEGTHTLSIKHKGLHISGSPFVYSVGQLSSGGYHKVQVGGPGVEKGEVGFSNVFNIYTREAGAGELSVAVEGPSDAVIKLEERPHGFLGVSYKVKVAGMYDIHIKFNDVHIPGSPFRVHISPDSGVARNVTVHSLKDRGLQVDKASTFTVSYNGAAGTLNACVRTPSGGHEDCFIQEMDTGLYGLRFIPKENGVHYLDIKLNDHHIPDSPFAVMVGSMAADPAMVLAHGDGLERGTCGTKNKFVVRTAGAGSSFLAIFIEGPSKCALSCREIDEGYEFSYTPFASGNYLITIKYGNINIAGSPYQAEVTARGGSGSGRKPSPLSETSSMVVETVEKKPGAKSLRRFRGDASKVQVRGPGLKKARTNQTQTFSIDVKDAGHAMLCVGMVAPSGLPEPELMIKKNNPTSYTVSYKVVEAGEHTLCIRFGDEEVPGSPFSIGT